MAGKAWSLVTPADDENNYKWPSYDRDIKEHTQLAAGFYTEQQDTPDQTVAIYSGVAYFNTTKVGYAGLDVADLGTAGAFEVSALTADYYNKILFTLDSSGTLATVEGTEGVSAGAVVEPVVSGGKFPISMVTVQDDGTGTAGTILTIEQSEITQVQGAMWVPSTSSYSSSTKTADYTILTTDGSASRDNVTTIILGAATAADRTFTIDSLGASEDGYYFAWLNDSNYRLTTTTSDSDSMYNSGAGLGVECPEKGTFCMARYDHARTHLDIVEKTGGRVMIEGLKLNETMQELASTGYSMTLTRSIDKSGQHLAGISEVRSSCTTTGNNFVPGDWDFVPSHPSFARYLDSPADWDICGAQTGYKTLAGWVRHNALGSDEYYITQHENVTNYWSLRKRAEDDVGFILESELVGEIVLIGGSLSAATWYHIAVVFNAAEVGLYVDGVQVAYDGTWNTDTFTGFLYIGQSGASDSYMDGRMQDWHLSYNNPYGAAPNATPDDTFTKPAALFQGVML